jgi:hypothetical protein
VFHTQFGSAMYGKQFPIQFFQLFLVLIIPKLYISTDSASDPVACVLFFAFLCPQVFPLQFLLLILMPCLMTVFNS